MGFLDEEALVRTLARQLKIPIAWLRGKWVEQEVLDLVPVELALHLNPSDADAELRVGGVTRANGSRGDGGGSALRGQTVC